MEDYIMEISLDEEDVKQDIPTVTDKNIDQTHSENWKLDFNQKDVEDIRNDPFCCILEHIFNKLPPKELLNASLVSKNWYNVIGKLETFNRIKLNFVTNDFDPKSVEYVRAIKNSSRIYENIDMTLWNLEKDINIAEQIIIKYSPFLKGLKLTKFGGFNSMLNETLDMPHLEELDVQVSCGRLNWKFFENVTTLKKLKINGIEPKGLVKCLSKNADLEELTFYENAFMSYFTRDMSKYIKFQLKSLKVLDHNNQLNLRLAGEMHKSIWSENQKSNFHRLLSSQHLLRALHLDVCNAEDLDMIFTMPSLHFLEINKIVGKFPQDLSSSNIRSFMTRTDDMSFSTIDTILSCLPKLTSLYIHQLSVEIFFRLLGHQHLKDFHYFWASEEDYGRLICLKVYYTGSIYVTRSTKDEFINLFS